MQQDELSSLIDKTATLMVQYERHGGVIDARLQNLTDVLENLTQQLPEVVRASSDGVLQTLPAEMGSIVRDELGSSIGDYRQCLGVAANDVGKASQALAGQLVQLQRLHRQLIWKAMGAALLTIALLLAGGAWLSMHYTQVIRDNQLSAGLLKAYNSADVTLCGSRDLCANVDAQAVRYGERGQYLTVKRR